MVEVGLETEIQRILSACWFVEADTEDPSRQLLIMRHPTLHEVRVCEFYRQKYVNQHKGQLISREEATSKAIVNKQWHPSLDIQAQLLYEQYDATKADLEEARKQYKKIASFKSQVRRLEHQLVDTETRLAKLLKRKQDIFENTLEYRAERHFVSRLVGFITNDVHDRALWNCGDLSFEEDTRLIDLLIDSYLNTHTIDVSLVRQMARSSLWRYRWQLGKPDPASLFDRKLQDLSPEQNLLVFWSQVYDMAYEAYDPPPQNVIDDDVKFDGWLEKKCKEAEIKRGADYYGLNKEKKGNEHFVFVDGYYNSEGYWIPYTEEEKKQKAEAIYAKNVPIIRQMQRVGNKRLDDNTGTFVREQHLRKGWFKVLGWDKIKGKDE